MLNSWNCTPVFITVYMLFPAGSVSGIVKLKSNIVIVPFTAGATAAAGAAVTLSGMSMPLARCGI